MKEYKKGTATKATTGVDAWKDVQWTDMEDEHFIVWMRYAGLPTFRKLWGRVQKDFNAATKIGVDDDLTAGDYTITITNQYDVAPFEGKKSIVFSNTNSLGGKSYKLAYCFFIAGGFTAAYFCFLMFKMYKSKQA